MNRRTGLQILFALTIGLVGVVSLQAGEPPGAPAPTMATLQEIEDKASVAVAATGQVGCWDHVGIAVSCGGTGQDGEYRNGDSSTARFTDEGDGTVKDNLTGLIWLRHANCFPLTNWTNALSDVKTLANGSCGLADGSVAGDWRLPNIRELHSLIDIQNSTPALPAGHPFSGVQPQVYWSSTTHVALPLYAWRVALAGAGAVSSGSKGFGYHVLPVRSGQ